MTILRLVKWGAATLLTVFVMGGAIVGWQVNAVRMGGAMHLESRMASDLIADILPPPEYIVEPYLEVSLVLIDPATVGAATQRLDKLKSAYDDRQTYWAQSRLPADIKQSIIDESGKPAREFWSILERRFLPAARARDDVGMRAAYVDLRSAYTRHRKAIDDLVVAATAYQNDVEAEAGRTALTMTLTLSFLGIVLLGSVAAVSIYVIRRVIAPMADLSATTAAIADGSMVPIPHTDRKDELGAIAHALERFAHAAEERRNQDAARFEEQSAVNALLGRHLSALHDGDLTQEIGSDFPTAFGGLRQHFNAAVAELRTMVQAVYNSATAIGRGSAEIASATEDLARRTEASAANHEQTNAALQQVGERLGGTLQATDETRARADEATRAVAEGRATGEHAAASMDRVSERARDIGSVIEGLDKIAFQTRVLAMNAAVEAGNAGEAGRGFAVVADLVSALAVRAESEAQRVRDLITETRAEVEVAADAVRKMDGSLEAISDDVDAVHSLLVRLHEDSEIQARAVTEIAAAMRTLDGTTQQNAAMVEQASAAARALTSEATALNRHATAFRFDTQETGIINTHTPPRAYVMLHDVPEVGIASA